MRLTNKRTLGVILVLVAVILLWSQWTPSVESILQPLHILETDFNLKRTPNKFGTQPILFVVDMQDSNVYSRYVPEILKAEGILCFETMDISEMTIDSALLERYSLVVTDVSSSGLENYTAQLTNYVRSGGRLLMIAPPVGFDSLLGVHDLQRTISDGYVVFDSISHITSGLSHTPLQFFGLARQCNVTRGSVLARISQEKTFTRPYVAMSVTSNGQGRTGFIAYDLGKSVVFTRQGRPPSGPSARAIDKDGDGVFKTSDLYYDSFDYTNNSIPQADEQQKLFVNLIFSLLEGKTIFPRVWYFPHQYRAVALMTGDHHGWASQVTMPAISSWLDSVGGHFTFFIYPDEIDSNIAHDIAGRGHALDPHLYYPTTSNRVMRLRLFLGSWFSPTYFFRPRFGDLESEVDRGSVEFAKLGLGEGRATRLHYLVWWGWSETPQLLAQRGYQLDLSVSGIDPRYAERPGLANPWNSPIGYGYVNGSGQPMKVITQEGKLVDLFCQLTEFEDDVAARECLTLPPNDSVTTSRLIGLSKKFIDESITMYHSVLVWNFHPEHVRQRWPLEAPTTGAWIRGTVQYLKERGVPMLSVNEWLSFIRARRSISLTHVSYNPSTHSGTFLVSCPNHIDGLTLMIPLKARGTTSVEVSSEGTRSRPPSSIQVVNGLSYLVFQTDLRANQPVEVSFSIR